MVRAARTTHRRIFGDRSRAHDHVVMAWLATSAALLAVLLVTAIDTLAGRWFSAADADPPDPAGASLIEVEPISTVTYGSVEWRLLESRMVPRADDTPFSRPVVIVEMVAVNRSDHTVARPRRRDLSLLLWDGTRVEMDRFENTTSTNLVEIAPGQAEAITLVFKPALRYNPSLDLLSVEIREPNRYPALINLDGSPGSELYPRHLAVANGADPSTVIDGVTVGQAILDVDFGPFRSPIDQRLVVVTATVEPEKLARQATTIDGPSATVGAVLSRWDEAGFWSLEFASEPVEGEQPPAWSVEAIRLTVLEEPAARPGEGKPSAPADRRSFTVEVVFLVPVEATSGPMVIGLGEQGAPAAVLGVDPDGLRSPAPRWRW